MRPLLLLAALLAPLHVATATPGILQTKHVNGYTKKDGTKVSGYERGEQQAAYPSNTLDDHSGLYVLGGLAAFGIFVTGIVVLANRSSAKFKQKQVSDATSRARSFLQQIRQAKGMTPVQTQILLKPGEQAYWTQPANLYEPKTIRRGSASGVSFGLGGGVRIGSAEYQSSSVESWKLITSGTVVVTNKRVIFDGSTKDRSHALDTLLSVNCTPTVAEISFENSAKPMCLAVHDTLILRMVIQICRDVSNPSDLSDTNFTILDDQPAPETASKAPTQGGWLRPNQ